MKEYGIAFIMTQSMFCSLPFPCRLWKEEARNKMLLFLPVIGLEIGVLWVLLDIALQYFKVPMPVVGLAMCALPYLLTGFIHLDGFLDVTDAVCSWRDLEQRRKILKDSHVGSFAVIWCVFLLLAGAAFFTSVPNDAPRLCLLFVPIISRCCSALAVLQLKPMDTSQYARSHEKACGWHVIVLALAAIVSVCVSFLWFGKYGFVSAGALLGYGAALFRSYRSLDGMNGDISGYCLTISELCAVAVYALI